MGAPRSLGSVLRAGCAAAVLIVGATGLAGCSGADEPSTGTTPATSTPTPTPTTTDRGAGATESTATATDATPDFELLGEFRSDPATMPVGIDVAIVSPPDGALLFVSTGGGAFLYETATGALAARLDDDAGHVRAAAFSPDGAMLATGHADGSTRVWDTTDGAPLSVVTTPSAYPPVDDVAFSPDGSTVATSSWVARTVRLVDPVSGTTRASIDGADATFAPDGLTVATVVTELGVDLWDVRTGALLAELRPPPPVFVSTVAFSPDSARLLIAGTFGEAPTPATATVWDVASGTTSSTTEVAPDRPPRWRPDGTALLVGTERGEWQLVDPVSGEPAGPAIATPATDAAFVTDDLVATTTSPAAVAVWSSSTGTVVAELARTASSQRSDVQRLVVSDDGTTIVGLTHDGWATVWHDATAPALDTSRPPPTSPTTSTPATTSTMTPTVPPAVVDPDALLRGGGLGPWRFGDDASSVEAFLTERLGPPSSWEAVRGAALTTARYPTASELRIVSWPWGLDVAFGDLVDGHATTELRLVAWQYAPFGDGMTAGLPPADWPLLRTPVGLTGGTPLADLRVGYGTGYTMDADGPCPGPYTAPFPPADPLAPPHRSDDHAFTIAADGAAEDGLRGHADGNLPAYVGMLEAGLPARCPAEEVAPPPSTGAAMARPVLRADGLDDLRFGAPAADVLDHLEDVLGPPDVDAFRAEATGSGVAGTDIGWGRNGRVARWDAAGLVVVFSDTLTGLEADPPRTGDLRFAAWWAGPRLRTATGGGVGAGVGPLVESVPELRFGRRIELSMMGVIDEPRAFDGPDGLRGFTEPWNVVLQLQRRLVAEGYDLEADGRWTHPTVVALRDFATRHGLDPDLARNPLPPELSAALGVRPPDTTLVVQLSSGANALTGQLTPLAPTNAG